MKKSMTFFPMNGIVFYWKYILGNRKCFELEDRRGFIEGSKIEY